jgi:uncharacterized protein YdbL (DUF1318 family)
MRKTAIGMSIMLAVLVTACVTINVYFPEAAAVEAADRIIDKVRGDSGDQSTSYVQPTSDTERSLLLGFAQGLGSFFISTASADDAIDFDKPSPQKQALEDSLAERFKSLRPYLDSGAIGLTDAGLLEFRDRNLVPLKDRNGVVQLVAAQNNDWNALYAEIARLNDHPEWQDSIRRTFSQRWVAKANSGWYYRDGGVWKQK